MKPITDVISLETIAALPTTENIENTVRRIEELESFSEMRDFHAANIEFSEFETLLAGCSQMIFNGNLKDRYVKKIKQATPSKQVIVVEDFI